MSRARRHDALADVRGASSPTSWKIEFSCEEAVFGRRARVNVAKRWEKRVFREDGLDTHVRRLLSAVAFTNSRWYLSTSAAIATVSVKAAIARWAFACRDSVSSRRVSPPANRFVCRRFRSTSTSSDQLTHANELPRECNTRCAQRNGRELDQRCHAT